MTHSPQNTILKLRINDRLAALVRDHAQREGMSISAFIRDIALREIRTAA